MRVGSGALRIDQIESFVDGDVRVTLDNSDAARRSHKYLLEKIAAGAVVYGVNTGFGSLQSTRISDSDLGALQNNLIRSHACGTGAEVEADIVRLMLLFKIATLLQGRSGVGIETVERLLLHLDHDVLPVVLEQGSLGASGDLAPLAHLCLPLIGEGQVRFRGEVVPAGAALDALGWAPLRLGPKEGLALLNGTQFMAAHAALGVIHGRRLAALADLVATISLEAFGGRGDPFDALVHETRPHPGQIESAARVRWFLDGSELLRLPKERLQDPYSFRCVPQVHGATIDVIRFARSVIEREINGVCDNPLVFADEDRIVSAGNFHGQPLAFALDFLAIALAELGAISERRTFQLLTGTGGLPVYLVNRSGLNSGFMIPQYVAASVVSRNKQLCTPASVDSIVTSNGQEDHVSMGGNAATKLLTIIDNVYQVLAIELFTAAQALEFRRPGRSSATIELVMAAYREIVPFLRSDDIMYEHLAATKAFVKRMRFGPAPGTVDIVAVDAPPPARVK